MPAPLRVIPCLLLVLGLSACAGGGVQPPVTGGPFGAPPSPPHSPSFPLAGIFLAGLGAGVVLAGLWRRRRMAQALRQPGGRLPPGQMGRLRAALAIMEELILAAGRQVVVVRMKDWLRAKARGPGDRL